MSSSRSGLARAWPPPGSSEGSAGGNASKPTFAGLHSHDLNGCLREAQSSKRSSHLDQERVLTGVSYRATEHSPLPRIHKAAAQFASTESHCRHWRRKSRIQVRSDCGPTDGRIARQKPDIASSSVTFCTQVLTSMSPSGEANRPDADDLRLLRCDAGIHAHLLRQLTPVAVAQFRNLSVASHERST